METRFTLVYLQNIGNIIETCIQPLTWIYIYYCDTRENYCHKYKLGNLHGCFTFYIASALNTFQKHTELECLNSLESCLLLSTIQIISLIYNLLLLYIYKLKTLLCEATNLTLNTLITIYLETYLQKFNWIALYMKYVTHLKICNWFFFHALTSSN